MNKQTKVGSSKMETTSQPAPSCDKVSRLEVIDNYGSGAEPQHETVAWMRSAEIRINGIPLVSKDKLFYNDIALTIKG